MPAKVRVPDVIGMSRSDAKAAIEAAGFVVEVVDKHVSDPDNVDVVLDQDPVAGTKLLQGMTVTITVGSTEVGTPGPSPEPQPEPVTDRPQTVSSR